MNKTSIVEYLGELRTKLTHIESGDKIFTDAPKDNEGRGEAFAPTDLVATSLASCMISVMGIKARKNDIDLLGTKAEILKVMQFPYNGLLPCPMPYHQMFSNVVCHHKL